MPVTTAKAEEQQIAPADLCGCVFGRLTVQSIAGKDKYGKTLWDCLCACGNELIVRRSSLTGGNTRSCGCLQRDTATELRTTHGMSNTSVYHVWEAMLQRCLNPDNQEFKNYGVRGITVCERWLNFENFFADMGHPPLGLTLDRIDNNGNYELSNCKWSNWVEQNNNRRAYKPRVKSCQ